MSLSFYKLFVFYSISFIYKRGYGFPSSSHWVLLYVSTPIKAIGSPFSFSATIKWSTPLRAWGTYSLIWLTSSSERKRCVALTDSSQIFKSSDSSLGVLFLILCIFVVCLRFFTHKLIFIILHRTLQFSAF